jgi:hypothetical protein
MPINVTLMAKSMRFVVVHYHVFKNAGTTVENILEREFPEKFAKLHGPGPEATLDGEDLAAFLKDHPNVKAVSSHHLRYPTPLLRNIVIFDCCFLRHPLERLASLYSYYRRIESHDLLCRNAHRQTPSEFIRHLLNRSPEQVSNVQVTYLANRGAFTRPVNEADLDRAACIVRNMALPGLVEMFQESMVAGEYFMRPAFPSLRLSADPANVSRPVLTDAGERKQRLLELWGRDLYGQLVRLNRLDIRLVEQTGEEIRRRLSVMPAVQSRISEFDARCRNADAAARSTVELVANAG